MVFTNVFSIIYTGGGEKMKENTPIYIQGTTKAILVHFYHRMVSDGNRTERERERERVRVCFIDNDNGNGEMST